ncbi:MAG: hypothetical protein DBY32_04170 [Phascolarctobacterium sp.]|nr:MAG: hypothetical protein DBY32_04170 [Phascolarctobacterium sp.]
MISERQYRRELQKQLKRIQDEVLPKDYYCDRGLRNFECDKFIVDDILFKIKSIKRELILYKALTALSLLGNVLYFCVLL